MTKYDFAANGIQNSLRELNLLDDVLAGKPPHTNYLFSFGSIDEGHTGSTFEGLWVAGVLSALKSETLPEYGGRCGSYYGQTRTRRPQSGKTHS